MLKLDFDTSIELLGCIVGIVCLSKDKSFAWRTLRVYLVITCLAELTALYLTQHRRSNAWLYNISILFEMGCICLMFSKLLDEYISSKKLIRFGYIIFAGVYISETGFHIFNKGITGILKFNDLTNDVMSVMFVFYALYYFYLLLKDENYIDLRISANFWWVIGVLFFYFGSTAVNLYRGINITNQKTDVVKSKNVVIDKAINDIARPLLLKKAIATNIETAKDKPAFSKINDKLSQKKLENTKTNKEKLTEFILGLFIALLYICWIYSFICRRWLTTT